MSVVVAAIVIVLLLLVAVAVVVTCAAFVGRTLRQYLQASRCRCCCCRCCLHNLYTASELHMFLSKLFSWPRHVLHGRPHARRTSLVPQWLRHMGLCRSTILAINFGAWPATRSLTLLNLKGDMVKQKWRQQQQQQPNG